MIVALTFVAAPFYLRQAQAAFAAVEPRPDSTAARTLGAGEARAFWRVAIPCAGAGIATGMALAWGRALGEFGATLMFAGSFQGITQTAPLAIFASFATDFPAALALSAVLVAVSGGAAAGGEAARPGAVARRGAGVADACRRAGRDDVLREFELDVELDVEPGAAWRWSGPRAPARAPCCARSPACTAPTAGGSRSATRSGSTPTPGSTCRPSGATAATCSRSTRCSRT